MKYGTNILIIAKAITRKIVNQWFIEVNNNSLKEAIFLQEKFDGLTEINKEEREKKVKKIIDFAKEQELTALEVFHTAIYFLEEATIQWGKIRWGKNETF